MPLEAMIVSVICLLVVATGVLAQTTNSPPAFLASSSLPLKLDAEASMRTPQPARISELQLRPKTRTAVMPSPTP